VVSAVRDVGHRKSVEQRLTQDAMTDRLTGIANRRAFDAHLDLIIANAGADGVGCVALFDIDHFKRVNDQHGHAAGDKVLRNFAELARSRMRDMDYLARFGGEEFAVVLPGASPEQARLVCDRLRAAVAASVVIIDEVAIRITLSGGVARYDGSMSANEVLAAADGALYDAKRSGRDRMALAA
jgi:diguanylate cyclase (GGDEF)-like protein